MAGSRLLKLNPFRRSAAENTADTGDNETSAQVPANAGDGDENENTGDASTQQTGNRNGKTVPIVIASLVIAGLSAGGFYAGFSGMLSKWLPTGSGGTDTEQVDAANLPETYRPAVERMVVDLSPTAQADHLRASFSFVLVAPDEETVDQTVTRYKTALQTYLRALDESDLQQRAAIQEIMRHGERRLRVATPDEVTFEDFYVTDFVLK